MSVWKRLMKDYEENETPAIEDETEKPDSTDELIGLLSSDALREKLLEAGPETSASHSVSTGSVSTGAFTGSGWHPSPWFPPTYPTYPTTTTTPSAAPSTFEWKKEVAKKFVRMPSRFTKKVLLAFIDPDEEDEKKNVVWAANLMPEDIKMHSSPDGVKMTVTFTLEDVYGNVEED